MTTPRDYRRFRAANENASGFATKISTTTEPTGDGVLDLARLGGSVPCKILLVPFLLGGDGDTTVMRVIGWSSVSLASVNTLWVPVILGEFTLTASTAVGVAGAAVLNTERFADTIVPVAARIEDAVVGAGTAVHSDVNVLSPTNDTPGHIIMPLRGMHKIELTSDQTGGTSTFNCLYKLLDDED